MFDMNNQMLFNISRSFGARTDSKLLPNEIDQEKLVNLPYTKVLQVVQKSTTDAKLIDNKDTRQSMETDLLTIFGKVVVMDEI